MGKIIQCLNDPSPVTVKITVNTGASIWRYDYVDRGTTYTGNQGDGKPHLHALGYPHELDMISDAWSVIIVNQANEVMQYKIVIQWFQGETQIDEWIDQGNISIGDSQRSYDNCTFLEYRPA